MSKHNINTNFDMIDYIGAVDSIVSAYFDDDGTYQPHIGKLTAMSVFYNEFFKSEEDEEIVNALNMFDIVKNSAFIEAFNEALITDKIKFDFANAYKDALDIINNRKNSISNILDIVGNAIEKIIKKIEPILENTELDKILSAAKDVSDGVITPQSIVEAYGKSKVFKETIGKQNIMEE